MDRKGSNTPLSAASSTGGRMPAPMAAAAVAPTIVHATSSATLDDKSSVQALHELQLLQHPPAPAPAPPTAPPETPASSTGSDMNGSFVDTAVVLHLAPERRNAEFHLLFRSVPEDDPLMEDYSCALQKDILVQGRLYATRAHLCFNSNIFGWITNLVIAFVDILAIERRMTAFVIPNAILVTTTHSKYLFPSFVYREQAFSAIVKLWKSAIGEQVDGLPWSTTPQTSPGIIVSPMLASGEDAHQSSILHYPPRRRFSSFDENQLEKYRQGSAASIFANDTPMPDHVAINDTESHDSRLHRSKSDMLSDITPADTSKTLPRNMGSLESMKRNAAGFSSDTEVAASPRHPSTRSHHNNHHHRKPNHTAPKDGYEEDSEEDTRDPNLPRRPHRAAKRRPDSEHLSVASTTRTLGRPPISPSKNRSASHSGASSQPNHHQHASKMIATGTEKPIISIPKSIPKPPVYCNCTDHCRHLVLDRIFPMSLSKLFKLVYRDPAFWERVMKRRGFLDLDVQAWVKDEVDGTEKRQMTYGFPLRIPLGPKSTKCIAYHRITRNERGHAICVREVNVTPDIPSGSSFRTLTSQCLMRIKDDETRLLVSFYVEFLKPNFLSGIIERNAREGNLEFCRYFEKEVLELCRHEHPPEDDDEKNSLLLENQQAVPEAETARSGAWWSLGDVVSWVVTFLSGLGTSMLFSVGIGFVAMNLILMWRMVSLNHQMDVLLGPFEPGTDGTVAVAAEPVPSWWFTELLSNPMSSEHPTSPIHTSSKSRKQKLLSTEQSRRVWADLLRQVQEGMRDGDDLVDVLLKRAHHDSHDSRGSSGAHKATAAVSEDQKQQQQQ